jgi:xylitol oxidase
MARTNWSGNYTYRASRLHRPTTIEQAQEIVAHAERIRVMGSRHTFTSIADSSELLGLDAIPLQVEPAHDHTSVTVSAGVRYGELAAVLGQHRLALANMASLPHISVAGAVATATHGSGDANGNLATAVSGLEMITSDGAILKVVRGDPAFDGMVVALGSLGAVTCLTLDVEPAFDVRQRVYEGLAWDALFTRFDEIMAAGYSVSVFTRWGNRLDQVWVKRRTGGGPEPDTLLGAVAASENRNPIPGFGPENSTPQMGLSGPWSERLPHFRLGFTPSTGNEIQSEYLIPRPNAVAAIRAVRGLGEQIRPLLQISEIRTIAADRLWMSPQYGVDTVGIHFTWHRRQKAVERVLAELEAALLPLGARPHWGKLFLARAGEIAPLYTRLSDFRSLAERLDPRGAFRNSWLEEHVLGSGSQ